MFHAFIVFSRWHPAQFNLTKYKSDLKPSISYHFFPDFIFYFQSVSFLLFQEVVSFLLEFKAIDLFAGVIAESKAPRATVSWNFC